MPHFDATTRELVTIVIVTFDQAHFLGEAIESALAQDHAPIEVLVVDDGSTDNAGRIAERYPTVRYLRQENRGLPAARNAGLAGAEGAYVVFLDADDRLLPHAVAAGLHHLRDRADCAFVSGRHRFIGIDGAIYGDWHTHVPSADHYRQLLRSNYISMGAAVLFRRSVFAAVGGFDESLDASEDYELYLRIARRFAVCAHGEVVAEYRRTGLGMSGDHARMLRTVVSVVTRQRPLVRSADERLALREGLRFWRRYYGGHLAATLCEERAAGGIDIRWLRRWLDLARHAPLIAVRALGQRIPS